MTNRTTITWTMSRSDRFHWTTYEGQRGGLRFAIRQEVKGYRLLVQEARPQATWVDGQHFAYLEDAKSKAESMADAAKST